MVVEPDTTERKVTRTTWPFGPGSLIVSDCREEEEADAAGKARMDSKKSAVLCWRTSQGFDLGGEFLVDEELVVAGYADCDETVGFWGRGWG